MSEIAASAQLVAIAKAAAKANELDPALVCAVIEQESGWNPWAMRYEPGFMAKYVAPLYTNNKISATEAYGRCISWGLMQTLGQVAREFGYDGPLPQLCEPTVGIVIGCKILSHKIKIADNDVRSGLLKYNGGARPQYADEVLARMVNYKFDVS